MPKLQIDGVDLVDMSALEAETLLRQLANVSNAWIKKFAIELKEPISPSISGREHCYESGTVKILIGWETKSETEK
ncbi:hypothetical protein [Celeribacter sp.]|uniref:hypothetical protein n=1 Tax=Celeribacter sp. TaxID=1890673 RepID=UPI003A957045